MPNLNDSNLRPASPSRHAPGILRAPRTAALLVIAGLIAAASAVSFAESYRGLYLWALHHGLSGFWAAAFPAQVDVFIAVGELALFVALIDRWDAWQRSAAWAVTAVGLAVSVAGNIGHVAGHSLAVRATAAVPPLAAASALAVGLGVLKRVVEKHHAAAVPAVSGVHLNGSGPFTGELARGEIPSLRRIRTELHVGQDKASQVQAYLRTLTRTPERGRGGEAALLVPAASPNGRSAPHA